MFNRLRGLYIFGGPLTEFSQVQNSLARYCAALEQWASAKLCGVVQGMESRSFCRGRHLYSAGRPSRWASAHILVLPSIQLDKRKKKFEQKYMNTYDIPHTYNTWRYLHSLALLANGGCIYFYFLFLLKIYDMHKVT